MDASVFMDKSHIPDDESLKNAIENYYELWHQLRDFVFEKYPKAIEEWNYPGKKYGWSFRIKDKKRAIVYLLPRENSFKAAFVFGQKATGLIMQSTINEGVKTELSNARVYAEGRGIRIDIDESIIDDIKKLMEIKLAN